MVLGILGAMLTTTPTTIHAATMAVEEVNNDALVVTVSEFNNAEVSTTVWYKLTGTVKNLKDGDQYGNFDLEDETGSVYVYGLLSEKGGAKKLFQELAAAQGITNGSKITIIGNRGVYNEKIEVLNAYFVSNGDNSEENVNEVLTVTYNNSSTINNGQYTGTLADGTVLGFYLYSSSAYFCGAITSAVSVVVPEKVSYNGTEYNVQYFGYSSGRTIDFDEAPNVISLTLPSVLTYIYNYVPSSVSELHLLGTTPPRIYSSGYISSSTTVFVPKSAYGTYQNYCNNGNNGWNTSIDLKVEGWEPQSYTVTVNTVGTLANQLLSIVEQWTDVDELTIIGHLNSEDMKIFSRMTQLRKLDLSQTDITSIGGCGGLSKLEEIILPSTILTVEDGSFIGCLKLNSIDLPNATMIGSSAFTFSGLNNISLPNATSIGAGSFSECSNITSVTIPKVKEVPSNCFKNCKSLSLINLKNVESIGSRAFYNCASIVELNISKATSLSSSETSYPETFSGCKSLTKVILAEGLKNIPYQCFYNCTSLSEVSFPLTLESIEEEAFSGCPFSILELPEGLRIIHGFAFGDKYGYGDTPDILTSVSLPSTIQQINKAFSGCKNIKEVYCYAVVPPTSNGFNNLGSITLHVPAFSVAAYKLDDNWYKFGSIVAMDGTIDNLTINSNFTINNFTGLSDNVNLNVVAQEQASSSSWYESTSYSVGHLSVNAESNFTVGSYLQTANFSSYITSYGDYDDYGYSTTIYTYPYCATLIAQNEMSADNITSKITLPTGKWSFISFPFDVRVTDIIVPEGTSWVIRRYSGEDRASMSGSTWKNVEYGEILNANKGHIIHCVNSTNKSVEFSFKAVNNENRNNIFTNQNVSTALTEYVSESEFNKSWNLVGNPYPAYYDTRYMFFSGPITVWNPNYERYDAYSTTDDSYVMKPFEAFFVQRQDDGESILFNRNGRQHDLTIRDISSDPDRWKAPRRVSQSNERYLLNLIISDGTSEDKTRVVFNSMASKNYEIDKDAEKMFSTSMKAPQIYTMEDGYAFAINERPEDQGTILVGARFVHEGNYTLSTDNEKSVKLIDYEIGIVFDLDKNHPYTFNASSGISETRFEIQAESVTAISSIRLDDKNNHGIYTLDGKYIGNSSSSLPKGIYIKKDANAVKKVYVK